MIKIRGSYKEYQEYDSTVSIVAHLPKIYYDVVLDHVQKNMFMSYKRIAAAFKKVLISSIGDNLDKNDNQNLLKAEVCIEISCDEPSPDIINKLESKPVWFITFHCNKETLVFGIDKETEFIVSRVKV